MITYQIATNDHAMDTRHSAIGTSTSHFSRLLSVSVIFQILAAEPENEVGADTMTFSDASLLPIYSAPSWFFNSANLAAIVGFLRVNLYLTLDIDGHTNYYFLDFIPDGTPRYIIDKLVNGYHDFFLEDTWRDTDAKLPVLLILTESGKSERYIRRLIRNKQDSLDMTEPAFYTCTLGLLLIFAPQVLMLG